MSQAEEGDIRDPKIPLCFDTSAIWSEHIYRALRKVRGTFPERALLLPVIVVAERARQLRVKYGDGFNWQMIKNFIDNAYLRLDVIAFERTTVVPAGEPPPGAAESPWLSVVGRFEEKTWEAAERARFADHAVYATARAAGAILVVEDKPFRRQVETDGYSPGAITMERLLDACR